LVAFTVGDTAGQLAFPIYSFYLFIDFLMCSSKALGVAIKS